VTIEGMAQDAAVNPWFNSVSATRRRRPPISSRSTSAEIKVRRSSAIASSRQWVEGAGVGCHCRNRHEDGAIEIRNVPAAAAQVGSRHELDGRACAVIAGLVDQSMVAGGRNKTNG
jgi:hypothetical protein